MSKQDPRPAPDLEESIERLSDLIDQMDEAHFDVSRIDACLDALERQEPLDIRFDTEASLNAFQEVHRDLFPSLRVLPGGKERRPLGRRVFRRAAIVAAAAVVSSVAVAQALGVDLFGAVAQWSKGQFQVTYGDTDSLETGYVPNVQPEGCYSDGQAALDAYGIEEQMLPTWHPVPGDEVPGMEVSVVQEADGTLLFTEDHRTESGSGYTYEVRQHSSADAALQALIGVDDPDVLTYELDGRTYYILSTAPEAHTVTWAVDIYSGRIYGDIDLETARHMARSVTQRDEIPYTPPEVDQPPEHQTMAEALEALGMDTSYAPQWLPEGFLPVESSIRQDDTFGDMAYLFLTDPVGERHLSLSIQSYPDPSVVGSTVYEKDDTPVVEYVRGGVTFYIMNNLDSKTVVWMDGTVEGSFSGGLTQEECIQIIDSIPRYAGET